MENIFLIINIAVFALIAINNWLPKISDKIKLEKWAEEYLLAVMVANTLYFIFKSIAL